MDRNQKILERLKELMEDRIRQGNAPYKIVNAARRLADECTPGGKHDWREPISKIDLQQMITFGDFACPRTETLALIREHGGYKPINQAAFLKAQFIDLAHDLGRQDPYLVALEQEHIALEQDQRSWRTAA